MPYSVVTDEYRLPEVPDGWSWLVWKDEVDGHPKVFVRLRDEHGRCVNHGVIDVKMYGDGLAVFQLAHSIVERSGRHDHE